MDFDGIYYPWLRLWMLSAVPLAAFCLGAASVKVLGKGTWLVILLFSAGLILMGMTGL